ncbi:MAG: DUF1343 domain-containing protein [Rikenellaceae bacterium]
MTPYNKITLLLLALLLSITTTQSKESSIVVGAARTEVYTPELADKRVAILSNHTGMVGDKHTLDIMIERGVNVTAIFSPEHGFRGSADAGEHISNSVDKKSGVPILSLYDGNSKRPSAASMAKFETLVVDIQDVGLRFYTYYITMYHLMDACAEYDKGVVILDRPNPNGHYVDGPILDMKYKSGIGVIPIPVVHGMTLGELAQMINGEGWLREGRKCNLKVITCLNYTHQTLYELPIAPSPNLPNMKSVYLYPSTCLFEGTPLSLGRGTDFPFQVYGDPSFKGCRFSFTPQKRVGATSPPHLGKLCYGVDLRGVPNEDIWREGVDLSYLIDGYKRMNIGNRYFGKVFELLIGKSYVREMILEGKSAKEIEAMWSDDVERFKAKRKRYLLYEE